MKEFPKVIVFLVLSVFLFAANAFGTNITVFDHRGYKGLAPGGED